MTNCEITKYQLKYDRLIRQNKKSIEELESMKTEIMNHIQDRIEEIQKPEVDLWLEALEKFEYCLDCKEHYCKCPRIIG